MNNDKRTAEWKEKFLNYVEKTNPDLVMYFLSSIFFSPQMGEPEKLLAGYSPLDHEKDELKEKRDRMFLVFEEYYRQNPV
jgi:hypothetical protein